MELTQRNKLRECSFCGSLEGKPRIVGRFIVELSEVTHDGKTMLACQACRDNHSNLTPGGNLTIQHSHVLEHISKIKDMGF